MSPGPPPLITFLGVTVKSEVDPVVAGAAIAAIAGLIIAWRQLRNVLLQRRANTLLSLDQRWETDPLTESRGQWFALVTSVLAEARKISPGLSDAELLGRSGDLFAMRLRALRTSDTGTYLSLMRLCGFFETVGYVAKAGYLPTRDVTNLLAASLTTAHAVFGQHIRELQTETEDAGLYEMFLWLYTEERKAHSLKYG